MDWLAARAPDANNDMRCSTTWFGKQSKELVYKQSRSQQDYCVRMEKGLTVQVSSHGPRANAWHRMYISIRADLASGDSHWLLRTFCIFSLVWRGARHSRATVTSVFSYLAALSEYSEGDVIDADCLRKFLHAIIFNSLKSLYVYIAWDASGEARFSWALISIIDQ